MDLRRVSIGAKFSGIYVIIALPLIVALAVSFADRYQEHVRLALNERKEIALLTAGVFENDVRALGVSMSIIGRHGLTEDRTAEELSLELETLDDDFPIGAAALLDSSGRVVASTPRGREGEDLSASPEVAGVLDGERRLALSDVTTLTGRRGFHVASAVTGGGGGLLGAVVAFVPLEELAARAPLTVQQGDANVVDSNGVLVYDSRDPTLAEVGTDWSDAPFVRAALDGTRIDGSFTHPETGEDVFVAEVPIRAFGWAAGSAIPSEVVLARIEQQIVTLAAILAAVQIVVIAVVTVLSRRLVQPLESLVEDSRKVGEGDFEHAISAPTGDEIEQLADAMDQTRMKLRRYVEGLSALAQNARSLAVTVRPEDLERIVITGATDLFGATEVWILTETEGRLVPQLLHGTDLDAASLGQPSAEHGVLADVIRGNTPRIIADVRDLPPREWARRAAARDVRSVALLPLRSRTESYGILGVAAPQIMPWAEEVRERELLELFAGQVADAVESVRLFERVRRLADENARLYERERDVALRLQESLLRLPSSVTGVTFHHLYRSAVEATLVGGDFYDLFDLGGERLGVSVGDVSGKGLDAATLISFVKSSIRAYAYEGHSPATVLRSINDSVTRLSQPEEFVTVFFGVYDCPSRRLVYCSAGHPPAAVRRQGPAGSAEVELLPAGSPLLGAFTGAAFTDGETTLAPGDTLLLYTDGVSEARSPDGALFGLERLREAVRDAGEGADLTRAVFERISQFSDGRLADDVAMLALTPEGPQVCEAP